MFFFFFNLSGQRFYLLLNVIYQSIGMRTLLAGIFHISVVCGLHGFYFLVIVVVNILPVILRIQSYIFFISAQVFYFTSKLMPISFTKYITTAL
jgi:hypothetical protein